VPRLSEENREAGENPARSRHCEGRHESRRSKPGDLPERLAVLNAREKVFRPQWNLFRKDPVATCRFARQEGDGILIFKNKIWSALTCHARLRFRLVSPLPLGEGSAERDLARAQTLTLTLSQREREQKHSKGPALLAALEILALSMVMISMPSCFKRSASNVTPLNELHEVTDEAGRRVLVPRKIDRIVSLAPNLTEIVFAVGAGNRLVGRTRYCDYPAEAKAVAEIGDTMTPSIERIIALKPQVVLVSTASQLETFTRQLNDQHIAVYVTNPQSLDDVFRSIQSLGEMFGESARAATLVAELTRRAEAVNSATKQTKPVKVFYQVSGSPLYTIGHDAYLTDLVRRAGGISVTADVATAFPRFSDEAALAARPEAIILPTGGSMGAANSTVSAALKNSPAVLSNRVYKINDDHLSRPGPRLVDGLEEMARALHPEAFK
jgi:iron complex transport system substrate-binding protein